MIQPKALDKMDVTSIVGVFFDIDGTFSTDGKMTDEAYSALWDLKRAGKVVVPITGRPAGWCDHIARMWPVNAVVGENGAFYFMMKNSRMVKEYTADPSLRAMYKKELAHIREEVQKQVPRAGIASDQNYREFDMAIDFCEDVERLNDRDIDKIVEIFRQSGARTKISSIHVNGWFGDYDKLTTTKRFVQKELGMDLDQDSDKFVFCGDSPNDEPMFEYFVNSVGVANVMNFKDCLKSPPKYITTKESGAGFAELVNYILGNKS